MNFEIDNYTDKQITEFTEENTLYLNKMSGGYNYTFLVKFVSFSKGAVVGEILDIQPNNSQSIWINGEFYKIGSQISGAIRKCYTTQNRSAKWFFKDGKNWTCKKEVSYVPTRN
jgi:hypothetical protein